MIRKLLIFFASVAVAATSIYLLDHSRLRAQEGGDPPPGEADNVALVTPPSSPDAEKPNDGITIISYLPDGQSTAEDEVEGKNEGGKTDKLPGLEPDQVVKVTLKFGAQKSGETIEASAPDGGTIIAPEEGLVADEEGNVSFDFQVGHEAGLYQVALRDAVHEMGIQFWVMNNQEPEADPKVDLPGAEVANEGE